MFVSGLLKEQHDWSGTMERKVHLSFAHREKDHMQITLPWSGQIGNAI